MSHIQIIKKTRGPLMMVSRLSFVLFLIWTTTLFFITPIQAALDASLIDNNQMNLRGSASSHAELGAELKAHLIASMSNTPSPTTSSITIPPLQPINGTNITEAWQELPDWARYLVGALGVIFGVILTFF